MAKTDICADNLTVQMLGGFSIKCGEKTLTENTGRTKKVWRLIEYFLANRGIEISQEKMFEDLWGDEETDNPLNTLKNLVYRARTLLRALDEHTEFILFAHNTYLWNPGLPCTVDVDAFECAWKTGSNPARPRPDRIADYQKAFDLYAGEFLPRSSFLDWVIAKNAYYLTIYTDCVLQLVTLLMEEEEYERAIQTCEISIVHSPFEEEVHRLLLRAYAKAGQEKKAVAHYRHISTLFYNEFGVKLSRETTELYKEIVRSMHNVELDLSAIEEDLRESCERNGAFYCEYDIFKNIYRLQARSIVRTGMPIHVALITFTDAHGEVPQTKVIQSVMEEFCACITGALRKGDVVAPYSSTQFVVMLPLTTYENAQMVLKRIIGRFERTNGRADLRISTMLHALDPVDEA